MFSPCFDAQLHQRARVSASVLVLDPIALKLLLVLPLGEICDPVALLHQVQIEGDVRLEVTVSCQLPIM